MISEINTIAAKRYILLLTDLKVIFRRVNNNVAYDLRDKHNRCQTIYSSTNRSKSHFAESKQ